MEAPNGEQNLSVSYALRARVLAPLSALAQQTPSPPEAPYYYGPGPWRMWGGWGDGYGWSFGWLFPFFMMLCVFFACAASIYFLFARGPYRHHWGMPGQMMGGRWSYGDPSQSALQILNERFARGETQKDEYEEKKAAILAGR